MWTGALDTHGYGHLSFKNKRVWAHRLAWVLTSGPIPPGMLVCHRCDVRACVNPAHLFLGTQADNVADMIGKGRMPRQYGEGHGMARLTAVQVREIRERHAAGTPSLHLSREFGIAKSQMLRIVKRQSWKHVV